MDRAEIHSTAGRSKRRMSTSWRVAFSDRLAQQIITLGGLGTIAAVLLVALVLVYGALPLLSGTRIEPAAVVVALPTEASIVCSGVDEFTEQLWTLSADGHLEVRAVESGEILKTLTLPAAAGEAVSVKANDAGDTPANGGDAAADPPSITAVYRGRSGDSILLGFSDGSLQTAALKFETQFVSIEDFNASLPADRSPRTVEEIDALAVVGDSTYRVLRGRLVRRQTLAAVTVSERRGLTELAASGRPSAVDEVVMLPPEAASGFGGGSSIYFAAVAGKQLFCGEIVISAPRFGRPGETQWRVAATELPDAATSDVEGLMVDEQRQSVWIVGEGGRLRRYGFDAAQSPPLIQEVSLPELPGRPPRDAAVVDAKPLLGDNTLIVLTQTECIGVFNVSLGDAGPAGSGDAARRSDGLTAAHRFDIGGDQGSGGLVAASSTSRMFAVWRGDRITLAFMPTAEVLATADLSDQPSASEANEAHELWFSPRQDFLGLRHGSAIHLLPVSPGHPEASARSLFAPLWYEGYREPESIWQSSAAGVEAEAKLSMRPLIFGTLKATFYSMLIAVPIAIAAAIYSSEFLGRAARTRIKPAVELMAGIPSVVLGFIAALVLASVFREHLFACLLTVVTVISTLAVGGKLWLLLPQEIYLRGQHWRTVAIAVAVGIGVALAWGTADGLEQAIFGGDLVRWLDDRSAPAWPGWFLLLLPLTGLIAAYSTAQMADMLRAVAARSSPRRFAIVLLAISIGGIAFAILLAIAVAWLLQLAGLDARGPILGTYQERNALLVGGILGFAIIPIIYTIAEDALQAVPQHLRSASLGCGATPWQTTRRIVLPTALSGLFGGVMIGFGRAVGETMVVLMAAGNTPVMDVNPFNGYRTLSATLATELPEAARESTHYHVLFLAALLLFCFTLVANTAAELVRSRFRKRSYQL